MNGFSLFRVFHSKLEFRLAHRGSASDLFSVWHAIIARLAMITHLCFITVINLICFVFSLIFIHLLGSQYVIRNCMCVFVLRITLLVTRNNDFILSLRVLKLKLRALTTSNCEWSVDISRKYPKFRESTLSNME